MARPPVELPEQHPSPGDVHAVAQSIAELSQYNVGRAYMDVKTKTTNYSMDSELDRIILADGTNNTVVITLPLASNADHVEYVIKAVNITSAVTLTTEAADGTLDGVDINASPVTITPVNKSIRVCSDGTNWFRTDTDN